MSAIFLNGELVPRDRAVVSVYDHGLLYGDGVFEGIRCYKTDEGGAAVFRYAFDRPTQAWFNRPQSGSRSTSPAAKSPVPAL